MLVCFAPTKLAMSLGVVFTGERYQYHAFISLTRLSMHVDFDHIEPPHVPRIATAYNTRYPTTDVYFLRLVHEIQSVNRIVCIRRTENQDIAAFGW